MNEYLSQIDRLLAQGTFCISRGLVNLFMGDGQRVGR